jgi:hypothetical protein
MMAVQAELPANASPMSEQVVPKKPFLYNIIFIASTSPFTWLTIVPLNFYSQNFFFTFQ